MRTMSNSPLVVYTKLSPNCTKPRNHEIDTITIHCMAGNLSIETCGDLFAKSSRQASSNYGVGSDGRIGMYVEEANRSWCTSSRSNDHRAITIEVANSAGAPNWPVTDKAFSALIDLVTDICKRNNIKQLLWCNKSELIGQVNLQNMTVHRWFAAKACPGNYLLERHTQIAEEVNRRLQEEGDDMTEARVREIVLEVLRQQNPMYPNLTDVPAYWRPSIQRLIQMDILNGGTPNSQNAQDVNLRMDTVKALVLLMAYHDAKEGA